MEMMIINEKMYSAKVFISEKELEMLNEIFEHEDEFKPKFAQDKLLINLVKQIKNKASILP